MRLVYVNNHTRHLNEPISAGVCDTFFTRLRGFMFQRGVDENKGLLIVQGSESRLDASIHMFFVNFNLGVIWLNRNDEVVDTCLARRWRPFYMPGRGALKILEVHPNRLKEFKTGDKVSFDYV